MRARIVFAVFLFIVVQPLAVAAQRVNPDISVIGDMRYIFRDDVARQLAGTKDLVFEFEELEISITGNLNPYVRADVFAAIHGLEGPIELEEVYATVVKGLPVQTRFGKYYLDVGKLNTEHIHQFAWLAQPLAIQSFLGDEGAGVTGLNVRRLFGVGETAVTLSGNAFRADFAEREHAEADSAHAGESDEVNIAFSGRLSVFREINETNFLEIGGAYLYSEPEADSDLTSNLAVFDATYKWVPGREKGAKLRAELFLSDRELQNDSTSAVASETAVGVFSSAELRFRRLWDVGGYVDWTQSPQDSDMSATAVGAWLGYMPAEESTRFSIVLRRETSDFYDGSSLTVSAQVLWSLGPHKPHAF